MTCREFERAWSGRPADDLPAAARAHLAACPICAAMAQTDRAMDAMLRHARAGRPPVDGDCAWPAIERALIARSAGRGSWTNRWSLALAGIGLAAAVTVAGLLNRPNLYHRRAGPLVVARAPAPDEGPGSIRRTPAPRPGTAPPARGARPHRRPLSPIHGGSLPVDAGFSPRPGPEAQISGYRQRTHHPLRGYPKRAGESTRIARSAPLPEDDLTRLNGGQRPAAGPVSPALPPEPPPVPLPLAEARRPGSVVLDDLLSLNPVRLAALGETGVGAAARTYAAEAPATDARLQQHVFLHATMEKLSDVLAGLSKATGVTLVPRLEVAGERISIWEEDRPLMDVMRDLRHLHGWFWSRTKQGEKYVYSLWQDAQSRAREDAELQRMAMEQHRQFEEEVGKHVRALHASDEELKKMGRDDPYLIAQMQHPVVKNAWRLFAALSPDQQAQLLKGQTPNFSSAWGMPLELFPPPDDPYPPHPWIAQIATPKGDIVRLTWDEMSSAQQQVLEAIMTGAADWVHRPGKRTPNYEALQGADLKTASVSIYRSGDPVVAEGLSLRVDFQHGGKPYGLYSQFDVPPGSQKFYDDLLRKGEFRLWEGGQEEVSRFLGGNLGAGAAADSPKPAPAADAPDPVLDAPLSFTWTLPIREDAYSLSGSEVMAALQREIGRPLIADRSWHGLVQKRAEGARFRWEKRPLRELLRKFFPDWEIQADEGAIFLRDPDRLKARAQQIPPAVEEFLDQRAGPFTLDDMALLARSLTPWEATRLQQRLPLEAMDQLLAAQELLKLYGELAPAQRSLLPRGLPFAAMTPPQQRLFLQFAQRQRPYVEPWRFQQGGLSLTQQPPPPHNPRDEHWIPPLARMLFQVRFLDGDVQPFPVDLYQTQDQRWNRPLSTMIGKPFPFPTRHGWSRGEYDDGPTVWEPALADAHLRKRAVVILVAWPWAEPYAGTRPAPVPGAWARALAARLQDSGVTVVHVSLGSKEMTAEPGAPLSHSNLIHLVEPGDETGAPFGPKPEGNFIMHWPGAVLVGSDEIVRAVFDGQQAWDTAAVERAARALGSAATPNAR